MIRVLVFGTFDRFHPGHVSFLKQARGAGDWLIASVARDDFVKGFKGRTPLHSQQQRIGRLLDSGLVDQACLSDSKPGTYALLQRVKPDIICLGYDQDRLKENLLCWLDAHGLTIPILTMNYHP